MTYCTEFYLKKKNHSSKLLLVNSYSFTSLMFSCSNLLGFSSFWLHCTGTRFWNQEKKKSMDMQSVSHSPEGHRLPWHFSKLPPEWKPLERFPQQQDWLLGSCSADTALWAGHSHNPTEPLQGEPKVCDCPPSAVPPQSQGSRIQEEEQLQEPWTWCHTTMREVLEPAMPVTNPVVWALGKSLENKSAVSPESQEHSWCKKTHTLTPAGPRRQQMTCPVHLPRH